MAKARIKTGMVLAMLFAATAAWAADQEAGTVVREVPMFISPDVNAQRVAVVTRGRDVALVSERSNIGGRPWARVFVKVESGVERPEKDVSGWIEGKFLITPATPNGDQIIFGEAVDSERQAEQRGGRRRAAEDAMRLYYRLYQYFPTSPLAGEALWRAADIRWQLERAGVIRSSVVDVTPDLRTQIDDTMMKEVRKKYPQSKWAELAAYEMLENKMCADWKGESDCPAKESEVYEKYAREHAQSPKAAEALYNAAYRQAALVDIYKSHNQQDKAERARKKALELAQEVVARYPEGDWKPRAANLAYALQQNIAVYGVPSSQ